MNIELLNTDKIETLKQAAQDYNLSKVKELIDQGVSIQNIPLSDLFSFENNDHIPEKIELLRMLLQSGIDVNLDKGKTLSQAILNSNIDFALLLLKSGAEVTNPFGQLSLVYAVELGDIELVEILIDLGADIHDEDLLYSAIHSPDMIKYLISRGAGSVHSTDLDNALERAAALDLVMAARVLLENGANPNANGGRTIQLAFKSKDKCMVEILMNY
jgi:ankyrin repeat protein